jgi:ribosomal protein S18 acetylase RimI-like enzyme
MRSTDRTIAGIELLAHRTWPCAKTAQVGEWVLRAAGGFTRRANSCLPLGDPGLPLGEAVDRVESWYRSESVEPCFKILPGTAPELDLLLQDRGWSVATPSRTLSRPLRDVPESIPPELSASAIPDADWLRTVSLWDSESPEKARLHAELALRIPSAGFLRWTVPAGLVAVGLVALEGSESFLYDVVVHPEVRGKGIGRAFCQAAISWAAACGTGRMALQVLESNVAARALYASLGFLETHAYHYRTRPGTHSTCGC